MYDIYICIYKTIILSLYTHFIILKHTIMDEKTIFIEKIKQVMNKADMNISQFSNETGINISTLSQILNGNNKASLEVLTKIKNRFDFVSTDWLFLNQGEMSAQINNSQVYDLFGNPTVIPSKSNKNEENQVKKNPPENKPFEEKTEIPPLQQNPPQVQPMISEQVQKKIKRVTVYFDDNSYQDLVDG